MKNGSLFIGILLAVATGLISAASGLAVGAAWTAGIVVLCAIWWVFEPVPIPVTSLIPLAMFPLVGVLTPQQVGQAYGDPLVLLMMGGFMLSVAMERSNTHRRITVSLPNLLRRQHTNQWKHR